jgi:hypothetical protein
VSQLSFRFEYRYKDEREILLPVALRYAGRETDFFARVDSGASFCIFQRLHAETVGIVMESSVPTRISTVTGGFGLVDHNPQLYLSHYHDAVDEQSKGDSIPEQWHAQLSGMTSTPVSSVWRAPPSRTP